MRILIFFFSFLLIGAGCARNTQVSTKQHFCDILPASKVQEISGIPIERADKKPGGCFYFANVNTGQGQALQTVLIFGGNPRTDLDAGKSPMAVDIPNVGDTKAVYYPAGQLFWNKNGKGHVLTSSPFFRPGGGLDVRATLIEISNVVNANL